MWAKLLHSLTYLTPPYTIGENYLVVFLDQTQEGGMKITKDELAHIRACCAANKAEIAAKNKAYRALHSERLAASSRN